MISPERASPRLEGFKQIGKNLRVNRTLSRHTAEPGKRDRFIHLAGLHIGRFISAAFTSLR